MAAQGQGTAQGDAAQQGQQGQADGQQGAPDYGALMGTVEGLQSSQQETRDVLDQVMQGLAGAPWNQQQAPEGQQQEAPMEVDLSFLDAGDPSFDPQQAATQLQTVVQGLVNEGVQAGIQQHVAPLQEQQAEQRRQWEAAQLTSEFPELNEPDTAKQVVEKANEYAAMLVPSIGVEAAQKLANEPGFWRIMYAAGRSFDAAEQEGSGDPGAAHLEGGGGANLGAGQQMDLRDAILKEAKGGSAVLPFK